MLVKCIKCGARASSKCPTCRTVFPEDQQEAMLFAGLGFSLEGDSLIVRMHTWDADPSVAFQRLIHKLRSIPEEKLKQYACHHQWAHTSECIYCGSDDYVGWCLHCGEWVPPENRKDHPKDPDAWLHEGCTAP